MPITYDEIGNPTKIVTNQYWASSSNWEEYAYELEWEGRQLIGRRFYELYSGCNIWYDESYDIWFEYNADGIRTSKTVYETEYKYLLNGTQIIGETWTLYGTEYLLLYIYDETGAPIGIQYRTSAYAADTFDYFFFEKNLQGDIVAVYNANGRKIGSYVYDAWGNFRTTTVSGNTSLENSIVNSYNPFRYRGYYYDKDLGWYYLQTRYYNPQWGRFVNADGYVSTGTGLLGYNMFAYCNNNPVIGYDSMGNIPKWVTGTLNIISGGLQMAAAATLGATVGWTGIGAVAAGILAVNGATTFVQGIGQVVNDLTDSDFLREDNILRTGVQEVGKMIGGDSGAEVAGGIYDGAVLAAGAYFSVFTIGNVINQNMSQIVNSRLFGHNGGYGFRLGKSIELFYRNPNAKGGPGGTIISYNGFWGKFRIDWDPTHHFHSHPPGHS